MIPGFEGTPPVEEWNIFLTDHHIVTWPWHPGCSALVRHCNELLSSDQCPPCLLSEFNNLPLTASCSRPQHNQHFCDEIKSWDWVTFTVFISAVQLLHFLTFYICSAALGSEYCPTKIFSNSSERVMHRTQPQLRILTAQMHFRRHPSISNINTKQLFLNRFSSHLNIFLNFNIFRVSSVWRDCAWANINSVHSLLGTRN